MQIAVINTPWGLWEHNILPRSWFCLAKPKEVLKARYVIYRLSSTAFSQLFYTFPNSDSASKRKLLSEVLHGWEEGSVRYYPFHIWLPSTQGSTRVWWAASSPHPPKGRPGLFLGRARKLNSTWCLLGTHQSRLSSPRSCTPWPLPLQGSI